MNMISLRNVEQYGLTITKCDLVFHTVTLHEISTIAIILKTFKL